MGDNVDVSDLYDSARFTAEISTRMQVPDRLVLAGDGSAKRFETQSEPGDSPVRSSNNPAYSSRYKVNDLGLRQRDPRLDMQVPDRILLAGNNTHLESKRVPRELELDNAVIVPPTEDAVRVTTPPRSIRLDEVAFPTASEDDQMSSATRSNSTLEEDHYRRDVYAQQTTKSVDERLQRGDSVLNTNHTLTNGGIKESSGSLALLSETQGGGGRADNMNLTPYEEVQLIRRQMAKLNHRLMAVELENQQQQQREMLITVLVSAYFVGKVIMWLNRSY